MVSAVSRVSFCAGFCAAFVLFGLTGNAWACDPPQIKEEATPDAIAAYFKAQKKTVLTLAGYSGADYENKSAMIQQATRVLDQADPKTTIVNIGATADGIGVVYDIAKNKGFTTSGIVSTQARDAKATLSPCVDVIFFVKDPTWGGIVQGTNQLSATSTAMTIIDHIG